MKLSSLDDVLTHELQDVYNAEQQITQALPKMVKAAHSPKLKEAFETHLQETKEQVRRLENVSEKAGIPIKGVKCKGMEGLLKEGEELLKEDPSPVLDAALITAAQRVEHYEIAAYGSILTFARQLGEEEVLTILKESFEEEKHADILLTSIAEQSVNQQAEG